jgi:hypothetical protein
MRWLALFFLLPALASAAKPRQVRLDMELAIDGKHFSRPQLVITDGHMASITRIEDGHKTEVIVTPHLVPETGEIDILTSLTKDNQILTISRVITVNGEPAHIRKVQGGENPADISLSITPTKK